MTAQNSLAPLSINGIAVECVDKGRGRPLLFLHPGIGLDPNAPVLDRLAERARHRAEPSGLRRLRAAAVVHHHRRPRLFLSRSPRPARSHRHHDRRRIDRRLDRRRDRREVDGAGLASRARQRRRHQGRRPRDPRHRRHLRDHRSAVQRARLFRPEDRRARLQGHGGRRRAPRRAQPRSDRALRLVALHAQPEAQSAGCTASAFRRCSCGAPTTASSRRPTAAPIARRFPVRASRRSRAPAIFPISSSPRNSPARSSPSSKDNRK